MKIAVNGIERDATAEEQATINAKNAQALSDKPADDLAMLREERNRLLAETDWWASSDLTMTDAQTTYRQALRDITNTYSSMDDEGFAWPTKP
jgi:hypothetical protein